MIIPLLIANLLCWIGFFVHTFVGDRDFSPIRPKNDASKKEKWVQARNGWHVVSVDLLFAAIGLTMVNFGSYQAWFPYFLMGISIYYAGYGLAWLISLWVSGGIPKLILKLGQWALLWMIAGFTYWGASSFPLP